ncbi:winged helix-turn-helix transcriptional regulator [Gryllotalpicola reticulitermitis]|uniref:Winged helix-turn-helix transcriptional regulator n=1 Tax=Gryllotalpicola reticulitermitis TaxID=1184153 RepID=A0ABV8Q8C5_9MICO
MTDEAGYNLTCTIARSLEVLGARWNLLIMREAHNGITRFADFRQLLGIAPDVLSDRLAQLVRAGVLERRPYQAPGERPRDEYVLTQRGRDLKIVLAALQDWGDKHMASEFGPTVVRRHGGEHGDDSEVHVAFVDPRGERVPENEVYSQPRTGTPAEPFFEHREELVERAAACRS